MATTDGPEGVRLARVRYDTMAQRLRAGQPHPTLGYHPDRGDTDWWQAGAGRVSRLVETFGISPHHRVIDYGCGTLRLGGHFMRRLDRGNYFGLDVSGELIAIGRELVGDDMIADKAPHLAAIDAQALEEAEAFGASFVFSEAVSYHVMPKELAFYFGALERLARAPGCVLFFSVRIADVESEYIQGCWARPLQAHTQPLASLAFVKTHFLQMGADGTKNAGITRATLEFRRD